ncbi:hypothetical protein L596_015359 [Steinernema carpocapsae]|uniref:Uncharacterized protein n=1 Tax=Steinernema carpocapsae TaxID=34508 RepID=A0A4U5NEQ9_STECR|nr:hypothetical protein L596_015359 [Steinernema carpocapsae]
MFTKKEEDSVLPFSKVFIIETRKSCSPVQIKSAHTTKKSRDSPTGNSIAHLLALFARLFTSQSIALLNFPRDRRLSEVRIALATAGNQFLGSFTPIFDFFFQHNVLRRHSLGLVTSVRALELLVRSVGPASSAWMRVWRICYQFVFFQRL